MKAALSGGRGWLPLARSLCRGLTGKTGTVFGAEAAERAQCVPSVSQPGRRAAGSRRGEQPRAAAGGAGFPGKGGEMELISLEWRHKGPSKEGG